MPYTFLKLELIKNRDRGGFRQKGYPYEWVPYWFSYPPLWAYSRYGKPLCKSGEGLSLVTASGCTGLRCSGGRLLHFYLCYVKVERLYGSGMQREDLRGGSRMGSNENPVPLLRNRVFSVLAMGYLAYFSSSASKR